jgi:hypothetical protein
VTIVKQWAGLRESKHAAVFHLLATRVPHRDGVHSAGADGTEPGGRGPGCGHVGHAVAVRSRVCVGVDVSLRSGRSFGAGGQPGEELPILNESVAWHGCLDQVYIFQSNFAT